MKTTELNDVSSMPGGISLTILDPMKMAIIKHHSVDSSSEEYLMMFLGFCVQNEKRNCTRDTQLKVEIEVVY